MQNELRTIRIAAVVMFCMCVVLVVLVLIMARLIKHDPTCNQIDAKYQVLLQHGEDYYSEENNDEPQDNH